MRVRIRWLRTDEWGTILGLDRYAESKTLRRRLRLLASAEHTQPAEAGAGRAASCAPLAPPMQLQWQNEKRSIERVRELKARLEQLRLDQTRYVAADRRSARLRRLRPERPAHRGGVPPPLLRDPVRRAGEGTPRRVTTVSTTTRSTRSRRSSSTTWQHACASSGSRSRSRTRRSATWPRPDSTRSTGRGRYGGRSRNRCRTL